jgi:hypothetical protein
MGSYSQNRITFSPGIEVLTLSVRKTGRVEVRRGC